MASSYILETRLGKGATSTVWRATRAGQTVALKIGRDASGATDLAREALHASLALSAQLPELIDAGLVDARGVEEGGVARIVKAGASVLPFLALRWAPGCTLSQVLEQRTLDANDSLTLARDIGRALAELHAVGLAHGDVKPANIIVGPVGYSLIDLGLVASAASTEMRGATPRYLARGDAELGDARSRDLLALGLVVMEATHAELSTEQRPLAAARVLAKRSADVATRHAARPITEQPPANRGQLAASIANALLAPAPGARPSASWACETANVLLRDNAESAAIEASVHPEAAPKDRVSLALDGLDQTPAQRRVRASYVRLRLADIASAAGVAPGVSRWATSILATCNALRAMCDGCKAPPPEMLALRGPAVTPMNLEMRARWLGDLSGSGMASWALTGALTVDEPTLTEALLDLARTTPPELWVAADVQAALERPDGALGAISPTHKAASLPRSIAESAPNDSTSSHGALASPPSDGARTPRPDDLSTLNEIAELALLLSRVPPAAHAIARVERDAATMPPSLIMAAADALRLAGRIGRALVLVRPLPPHALTADILRRAGSPAEARRIAKLVISQGRDEDGRARACLARITLDEGDPRAAEEICSAGPRASAAIAEVCALAAYGLGDAARALSLAEGGLALSVSTEARARLLATLAFIKRSTDPRGARDGYRHAVTHAELAGAVLEEATYRTGEAAACVDLGQLEAAVETARRATLLWEDVLHRPRSAARAWQARAAAFASVDAQQEATLAAQRAIELAQLGDDTRSQAYAWWAIADAHSAGDPDGMRAAQHGLRLVGTDDGDDIVHAMARLLRHAPSDVSTDTIAVFDARCMGERASTSTFAQLSWWGSRAEHLFGQGTGRNAAAANGVVEQLLALASCDAPVVTLGKATYAGAELATALGRTDARQRLSAVRTQMAAAVLAGCPSWLQSTARSARWLEPTGAPPQIATEDIAPINALVRALSERTSLKALLDRVLDVLLIWTGAERGLLMFVDDADKLVVRAARNLSRSDLNEDQLSLSMSVARDALARRETVVAIDAMEELATSHASVAALKLRSVLALPLVAHGKALGVVYLDDRVRRGAFGGRELALAESVAPIAALAIADAHAQETLRAAVERAERLASSLDASLARKESALHIAEQKLSTVLAKHEPPRHAGIIGQSEAMRHTLALVSRVAKSNIPVMVVGDSGTGKELVARAIHNESDRGDGAFVSENCAAVPTTLLESTLFGHVKGAFTGADRSRIGLFEAADGGTLFLDEIGEMPLDMQSKLLRVLEDSVVRPVGATSTRSVNVRIIAATHRDLQAMVEQGTFREDLFYRLNVITLDVPALDQRRDDIPLLIDHFLKKYAPEDADPRMTRAARQELFARSWPGNVRQLENEVRRALLFADDLIDVEHLTLPTNPAAPRTPISSGSLRAQLDALEKHLVIGALTQHKGNQSRAAKTLGVSRYGLHKMIKRLDVDVKATAS